MQKLNKPSSLVLRPWSLVYALGIFGTIDNPLEKTFGVTDYASVAGGLPLLISNIVRITTGVGGVSTFFNLLIAGMTYITSNGEAEKIAQAWAKITQSIIGLVIIVGSFALAGVISQLLFGDPAVILSPVIYGPGSAEGTK